jgi:hypothetical protein
MSLLPQFGQSNGLTIFIRAKSSVDPQFGHWGNLVPMVGLLVGAEVKASARLLRYDGRILPISAAMI